MVLIFNEVEYRFRRYSDDVIGFDNDGYCIISGKNACQLMVNLVSNGAISYIDPFKK